MENHLGMSKPALNEFALGAGSLPEDGARGVGVGRELQGQELRWFLTVELARLGEPMRVRDLVAALQSAEFVVAGRASKVISDCLRWEIGRRRVVRLGRGIYRASAHIPRTTLRRLRQRVLEARERSPRPVRTQPLRPPRPLVSPGGPKRLRRRRFDVGLRPKSTKYPWPDPIPADPPPERSGWGWSGVPTIAT